MDKTTIAVSIFDKYAKEYQDKYMDVSQYHDSFDLFCESIAAQGADVLEIACGPGNITRYLLEKRPDLKILGIDLSEKMLALARQNNPSAAFRCMDARQIGRLVERYDAIMCGFCLPYLSREASEKLIADASGLLKRGGMLFISTMEADPERSGFERSSGGDEMYMHYHQASYLTAALRENGFLVVDLRRKDIPGMDSSVSTDLLIIASKA